MAVNTFVPPPRRRRRADSLDITGSQRSILGKNLRLKSGRLGVGFVSLSKERKSEVRDWLSQRRQEMLPEFVAEKFRRGIKTRRNTRRG
jgi:hypothetical protein